MIIRRDNNTNDKMLGETKSKIIAKKLFIELEVFYWQKGDHSI